MSDITICILVLFGAMFLALMTIGSDEGDD